MTDSYTTESGEVDTTFLLRRSFCKSVRTGLCSTGLQPPLNTLLRMYFICLAILNIRDIGMFISRVLFKAKQVLINTPRSGKNYLWTKPDNSNINDKNNTGIRYVLQHLTKRFHLKAYARTEWGVWAIRRGGIKFDFFSLGNPYLSFTWCTLQTDRHAKCQRYGKYI